MLSRPLVAYTLTAIRRDRLVQIMLVLMALGAAVSLFLGSAAAIEMRAFSVAMAGTVLRVAAVLGMVVFISFFLRRAFESREIDYLLATPLTRHSLLFSFAAAFMLLALVLTTMIGAVVGVMMGTLSSGWVLWTASVATELMITSMIALFFACVLHSATVATLCSLGYYTLARMMGLMIGIVATKGGAVDQTVVDLFGWIVKALSVVTPRFDLMAQSAWLVYGQATGLAYGVLALQTIVFCLLFFVCAAFDLRRIQF